uniref:INCENP_ARK-bind domain-containing protein n=1 Tax=Caenorhabditis tropicalis TaxID=1561998 RepID=A0A1I7UQ81_9PELO
MARFVSEDFAKQLQRTTAKVKKYDWFPPTTTSTTPTTQFTMTTKVMPPAPPLSVDQFFIIETTVSPSPIPPPPRKIEDDHKMEYMKESTAPLSNISEDMASDDPPEVTPEPAPFQQHQMNVWYPMKKGDIPHLGIFSGEFRRAPLHKIRTPNDFRLYNEYTKANRLRKPVRIEMDNASRKSSS